MSEFGQIALAYNEYASFCARICNSSATASARLFINKVDVFTFAVKVLTRSQPSPCFAKMIFSAPGFSSTKEQAVMEMHVLTMKSFLRKLALFWVLV